MDKLNVFTWTFCGASKLNSVQTKYRAVTIRFLLFRRYEEVPRPETEVQENDTAPRTETTYLLSIRERRIHDQTRGTLANIRFLSNIGTGNCWFNFLLPIGTKKTCSKCGTTRL